MSNSEFSKRFNESISKNNLNLPDVSRGTKINYEMIRRYSIGAATPRDSNLKKISKFLNVEPSWLLFGVNSIKSDFNLSEQRETDEWDSRTPLGDDEVEVPYYKSIELAAGHGCTNNEDYNGIKLRYAKSFFRRKGAQKDKVICFPIYGDSMSPNIPNGATVAVDTDKKDIIDGAVYAICQGDLCRLKRLYRLPNSMVRINSYNSIDNPDETDEMKNVQIIGKVFHVSFEM